jgi:hypothetical protein
MNPPDQPAPAISPCSDKACAKAALAADAGKENKA